MQDRIDKLEHHYIICGVGRVGTNVAHELYVTDRPFVAVEDAQAAIEVFHDKYPKTLVLHGDSSDDDVLRRAGIERAAGLFAVTGDDGKNLLITLTAKQLNPALRVVARCHEVRNIDKLKRVGADSIVSPDFTGGMRIASAMVRPHVVNFMDQMLLTEDGLRVEEVVVPAHIVARPLAELVPKSRDYILMAILEHGKWVFHPADEHLVTGGATLILMANPGGRTHLELLLKG